jgi:predicted dehydrogenase
MPKTAPRARPALAPPAVPAPPAARPELGIALLGHAFMGRAHSNAIRQVGHFFDLPYRVVPRVLVGRDPARVAAARQGLGFAEASTDLDAVLARDDVHVVDVATPNDSHHELARRALAAGKHVLCEKPLARTLDEARALAALARKSKARVGVWHNYRRAPAAALAQRILARGDLGEVRHVRATYLQDWLADPQAEASWRTEAKVCGSGAHGDLNAHLIDMTMYLTGLRFESVAAVAQTFTKHRPSAGGKSKTVDVDDALAFVARLSGGALGTFEATRVAPGRKNYNRIEINGSRGSLAWNFERMNELELFLCSDAADAQGFRTIMCMDAQHPYAANWWPDGHILGYEHTFVHQLADFVRAVHSGAPFAPDFDDGFRVQAVLEAALQSAKTGAFVAVPKK